MKGPKLDRTQKVGSYAPNRLELFDMHGNVWQWCSDLYHAAHPAQHRVIRGGSWNNQARNCRSAYRNRNAPGNRNNNLGFRVVLVSP